MTIRSKLLSILFLFLSNGNCGYALPVKTDLAQQESQLISLNFYKADIGIILQALADSRQMNLVMTDDFKIKQTIKLDNIDWNKALMIILKLAKLDAEIKNNMLLVKNRDDSDEPYDKVDNQTEQQLECLSLKIKYANSANLIEMITQQELLSERGKIALDERTNTLIIIDLVERFQAIKAFVTALDTALPQIHIAAHIVTMSNESLSELGIKWGYLGNSDQLFDRLDMGFDILNPTLSLGLNLANNAGNILNLELSALEAENQVEIIASPNLLASHNNVASIKQGTDIPYEVSNGNNGATSIEFKQAVLGLEVTPKILSDNQLLLDLYITQNTAGRSLKRRDGGEVLAIDTQEIKTQIHVKNGETIALGGIFQRLNSQDKHEVPILNKIPLIGHLFKYKSKKQQKRELVIFITPQLVE